MCMSELDLLNGDLVGHELFYFYCQDILLKFISVDEERHRFRLIYLSADYTTLLLNIHCSPANNFFMFRLPLYNLDSMDAHL